MVDLQRLETATNDLIDDMLEFGLYQDKSPEIIQMFATYIALVVLEGREAAHEWRTRNRSGVVQ